MIGQIIVPWTVDGDLLWPQIPAGYGPWSDVTGEELPFASPEIVVVQVEADEAWWAVQPEEMILWVE